MPPVLNLNSGHERLRLGIHVGAALDQHLTAAAWFSRAAYISAVCPWFASAALTLAPAVAS